MSNSLLASIEKLKGSENYVTWKFAMENFLNHESMEKCIAETGTETDEDKVKKAKSVIILSIDRKLFVHVAKAKTALEVWQKLKSTYEDVGMGRKISLIRQIVNTKLEKCDSMDSYVSEIITASHSLTEIGFAVPDDWLAIFLLTGLTDEFGPMIMALENSSAKITSDNIKAKLLQEKKPETAEGAFFGKNKPNKFNTTDIHCYYCKKKGHKAFRCPEKSTDNGHGATAGAFSAIFLAGKFDENAWYVDSGATRHMTMHPNWLIEKRTPHINDITAANGEIMKVQCSGTAEIHIECNNNSNTIHISSVLCIEGLAANLLSVSQITGKGNKVLFISNRCEIRNAQNELLATASLIDGLYRLNGSSHCGLMMQSSEENSETWHRRLCHVNATDLAKMRNGAIEGVAYTDETEVKACVACLKGKHTRKPFNKPGNRASDILEVVHGDLCGPIETPSIGGHKYCFVLVDDFSRRVFVYFMKGKDEAFKKFKTFKTQIEKQTGKQVKVFRSDNGKEFLNRQFADYFENEGIVHQTSTPYCHQQNGLVERTIRIITEKARCMLYDADLEKHYWAEALNTAAYVKNHLISKVLGNKSPIEIWTGRKPDVSHFRIFGSKVMAHIPKEKRRKFDAKSQEYLFVGYCDEKKGYRLLDPNTKKIIESRDVVFLESGKILNSNTNYEFVEFLLKDSEEAIPVDSDVESSMSSVTTVVGQNLSNESNIVTNTNEIEQETPHNSGSDGESEYDPLDETLHGVTDSEFDDSFVPAPGTPRRTQRVSRPVQRYEAGMYALLAGNVFEPVSVFDAMASDEKSKWQSAMDDEYQSLIENDTWNIVELPPNQKAIKCKWIFKLKSDSNGIINRHKARLVAKGCSQRQGIDYKETFSPVVRYSSIRFLISLAAKYDLDIDQMDAVTAFLQGDIDETIYMEQPEGFNDGSGRVCQLKRSIYGLKQASRQWNIKLNDALLKCGFKRCETDSCIYIRRMEESLIIVAVYVDDLLILYNNESWKNELKENLMRDFRMKDLGKALHILGIRIHRDRKEGTISLDQRKYTEDFT